jgi:hypothetical protein
MNYFLSFCMIAAVFFGILKGFSNINNVRNNTESGCQESSGFLSYLLNNK